MKKAVVLAAGMGSRLSHSQTAPKPLTLLHGEASLLRLFRQFAQAGITEVAVVVGYRKEAIQAYVEEHYSPQKHLPRVAVTFLENPRFREPNGVSVLSAREFVSERVLLSMADHLFIGDPIKQMAALDPAGEETVLLVDRNLDAVFDMEDATKVLTDEEGRILDIGKEIPRFNAIDTGLFAISPALMEALAQLPSPTLSQGVNKLREQGLMTTMEIQNGTWQDIDTPEALAHALSLLESRT